MLIGAKMAKEFLESLTEGLIGVAQIEQIVYLISIHDKLDEINSRVERMLVESDTLGMMDVDWVEPTYKGEEALSFPDRPKTQKRFEIFSSEKGISSLNKVVDSFKKFVIDRDFGGEDPRA